MTVNFRTITNALIFVKLLKIVVERSDISSSSSIYFLPSFHVDLKSQFILEFGIKNSLKFPEALRKSKSNSLKWIENSRIYLNQCVQCLKSIIRISSSCSLEITWNCVHVHRTVYFQIISIVSKELLYALYITLGECLSLSLYARMSEKKRIFRMSTYFMYICWLFALILMWFHLLSIVAFHLQIWWFCSNWKFNSLSL